MSVPASISARFLSSLAQDFIEGNIRLRKNTCFDAFLSSLAQDFIEGLRMRFVRHVFVADS